MYLPRSPVPVPPCSSHDEPCHTNVVLGVGLMPSGLVLWTSAALLLCFWPVDKALPAGAAGFCWILGGFWYPKIEDFHQCLAIFRRFEV